MPSLKGPPGHLVIGLSVRLSIRNSVHLHIKCNNISLGGDTVTKPGSYSLRIAHICPLGWGRGKCSTWRFYQIVTVAAGGSFNVLEIG